MIGYTYTIRYTNLTREIVSFPCFFFVNLYPEFFFIDDSCNVCQKCPLNFHFRHGAFLRYRRDYLSRFNNRNDATRFFILTDRGRIITTSTILTFSCRCFQLRKRLSSLFVRQPFSYEIFIVSICA